MNQQQKTHAANRVSQIFKKSLSELNAQSHDLREEAHNSALDDDQKFKLIIEKKAPFKPKKELENLDYRFGRRLNDVFDFSSFEPDVSHINKALEDIVTKRAMLQDKKMSLIDKIILGDSKEALEIIEKLPSEIEAIISATLKS